MAMAMIVRIAARVFPIATEVTQGPLSGDYETHIKATLHNLHWF
jgi:hypothetical protein